MLSGEPGEKASKDRQVDPDKDHHDGGEAAGDGRDRPPVGIDRLFPIQDPLEFQTAKDRSASDQRRRGHEIGIHQPVEHRPGGAWVVAEQGRVGDQPHRDRRQQGETEVFEAGVIETLPEGDDRQTFERPAHRDPFLFQLQRDGDTQKAERHGGEPGQPALAAGITHRPQLARAVGGDQGDGAQGEGQQTDQPRRRSAARRSP